MRHFDSENFLGGCNFPRGSWNSILLLFLTSIVSEVKAINIARISLLLKGNDIFQSSCLVALLHERCLFQFMIFNLFIMTCFIWEIKRISLKKQNLKNISFQEKHWILYKSSLGYRTNLIGRFIIWTLSIFSLFDIFNHSSEKCVVIVFVAVSQGVQHKPQTPGERELIKSPAKLQTLSKGAKTWKQIEKVQFEFVYIIMTCLNYQLF